LKSATDSARKIVERNFSRWSTEVGKGAAEKAAKIFSSFGFTFLPTFSYKLITTIEEATEYYIKFFSLHPVAAIIEEEVQFCGDSAYTHSGLYQFEVDDGRGGRKIVFARFTMCWRVESGGWFMFHFHSSVVKEADH